MEGRTEAVVMDVPRLEVRAGGRVWHATPNRVWTIGRSAEADVRLDNPRVSRDHAVLQPGPGAGFWSTTAAMGCLSRAPASSGWPLRGRCR
ncbi:FHA domain protein [Mycobacterium kansasii]|uniref:FHA domain protein n=1 Tax=Mycobacterium kansasii TaxID=1768 RepID=A0A1V3XJB3_MYCKA|nr:FHA domain protein [Mycobacterium kansasii]OOK79188.1 FHA domain protein [Mycobacterium kansasii]